MRLLLVGAFPYPHHQGSQVYFQEQAIALRAAGAEIELLTYASAASPAKGVPDRWRALDGFVHHETPPWTTPSSLRSGPTWAKPLADLGLAMTLNDAIASSIQKKSCYDAILTHNVEASVVAGLLGMLRPRTRIPLVYCVHTLMANELSTYSKSSNNKGIFPDFEQMKEPGGGLRRRLVDRAGQFLDQRLARHADGWIALTHASSRVMRSSSKRPGALIPPAIPDPRHRAEALDPERVARRHGLEHKGFYLYSGNLDGYQELELLAAVGRLRGQAGPKIILASHDPAVLKLRLESEAGLETRFVESETEMLSLLAAARASLVTRRAEGGFPIKLVNSLAVGTPPISFLEREWGLSDGLNALIAASRRPAAAFTAAVEKLDHDQALAAHLGAGARALYEANHRPVPAAEQSLRLIEQIRSNSA
jgi:glycosyltransferase involved in cell wall biosynthesis